MSVVVAVVKQNNKA